MTDEFPFSNAMSEITHSIYKSEFIGGKHSEDQTSHIISLDTFKLTGKECPSTEMVCIGTEKLIFPVEVLIGKFPYLPKEAVSGLLGVTDGKSTEDYCQN